MRQMGLWERDRARKKAKTKQNQIILRIMDGGKTRKKNTEK